IPASNALVSRRKVAAARALCSEIAIEASCAPSMRWKATRLPPESTTATLSFQPRFLDSAINAAVAESRKRGWKLNVAVVDSGGNLVAFQRMDGAQLASIAISEHKARASATFRRETKALEAGIQGGNNYLITLDGVIGSRGGIPLLEGGKLIGAIGCSGGTGSQDEVVCKAGAATVK